MTVNITINGQKIETREGQTILQAARASGIHIPVLCEHPALPPDGACRICLVEIEKQRALQPACTFPATEGLVIQTHSPRVVESRKFTLELLISDHPLDCMTCEATGECTLQDLAYEYGIKDSRYKGKQHNYPLDASNPFIQVERNKCILCRRCVRACSHVNGVEAISVFYRGFNAYIGFGADGPMQDSSCEFCGSCVAVCPTGALWPKMSIGKGRPWQVRQVETICSYCGVGCKLSLHVRDNQIIRVEGANGPANHGWTCVKGRFGWDYVHHPDRLTRPRVRRYLLEGKKKPKIQRVSESAEKNQRVSELARGNQQSAISNQPSEWVEVDWDTALDITAKKLRDIRDTHGSDSVGVLTSAKCLNEENYLMNKFTRQVVGTNNIDHCARLCHSSTVAGLATSFGSGAMSNSIDDIAENAQAFFVIGSNTTEQHPIIGMRLRQAVKQRGAILIVADPRRIPLTDFASLHLRHKPGTDIALLNGLMHIILVNGWEDKEFIASRTEGFDEFKATVMQYPPEKVSEITGVPVSDLEQAAKIMGASKPMAVLWAMGITQHITGVRNVMDLANLQMLLGNMGVAGGGVNPLRGQNNVQGACDMGGLPDVYPGYQPVTDPAVREKFAKAWGLLLKDEGGRRKDETEAEENILHPFTSFRAGSSSFILSDKVGMTVTEMIPGILEGKTHALYILGEDPVMSDADTNHIRHCLEQCDFIVLQELFENETAAYADVLLPGIAFAEKSGTFTNTERRVQMVRKAVEPPGEAREDWWITAELAKRILAIQTSEVSPYAGWNYENTAQIMAEISALTPQYTGISHARLERGETLQWPCPNAEHPGTSILHVGKFTRGLGKFTPIEHIPPAELPDAEYPMVLSTGRVLYHWHGGQMSRRSKGLLEIYPKPLIEVNDEDAEKLGLNGNKRVRVTSRRGSIEAEAQVTDRVPPGMVYGNFHFPPASVNELTIAALDPVSKIPEFKVCAVKVEVVK